MKHVMQGAFPSTENRQKHLCGKTGRCDRDLFRNKRSESGSAEAGRYDEEGKSRGIVPVFVEKEKRKA